MKQPKFFYARTEKQPRVLTIAYVTADDGKSARIGWSICNLESDRFVKKTGRDLATERFNKLEIIVTFKERSSTWYAKMADILGFLTAEENGQRITNTGEIKPGLPNRLVACANNAADIKARLNITHIMKTFHSAETGYATKPATDH